MDPEKVKALAVLLGVDPERLVSALDGMEGEDGEEGGGMDNFYYNPNIFARLHAIDHEGLRKLVVPNLGRLRKIQGIR